MCNIYWRSRVAVCLSKMKSKIANIIVLAFILLLFPACGKEEVGKANIGEKAPNFQYMDINGNKGSLQGLKGKVVLVRFWADWCPYCKYEMPRIDVFYKRIKNKGFDVVAVNVGQSRDVVDSFTAQLNITYPMIMDPEGELARYYGVKGIPTNFLMDREGIIKEMLVGEIFIEDRVMIDLLRPYFPEEGL